MKNLLSLVSITVVLCMLMIACSDSDSNVATTADKSTEPEAAATQEETASEPEPQEEEEPAAEEPEATPEPAESGPKRIRFARGKSEGTVRVGLGAGESQRFVIGVTGGQHLFIEVADFRPTIKMISTSKVTEVSEDESENTYYALTRAGGDIIFEIENGTRNSIATTVTVSINDKVY